MKLPIPDRVEFTTTEVGIMLGKGRKWVYRSILKGQIQAAPTRPDGECIRNRYRIPAKWLRNKYGAEFDEMLVKLAHYEMFGTT